MYGFGPVFVHKVEERIVVHADRNTFRVAHQTPPTPTVLRRVVEKNDVVRRGDKHALTFVRLCVFKVCRAITVLTFGYKRFTAVGGAILHAVQLGNLHDPHAAQLFVRLFTTIKRVERIATP